MNRKTILFIQTINGIVVLRIRHKTYEYEHSISVYYLVTSFFSCFFINSRYMTIFMRNFMSSHLDRLEDFFWRGLSLNCKFNYDITYHLLTFINKNTLNFYLWELLLRRNFPKFIQLWISSGKKIEAFSCTVLFLRNS